MSSFVDGFRGQFNPATVDQDWSEELSAVAPTLAALIRGGLAGPNGSGQMPPLTLMVFARDGKLRFSLGSQDLPRSFFGLVQTSSDLVKSIEEALVSGKGDWAAKRHPTR